MNGSNCSVVWIDW